MASVLPIDAFSDDWLPLQLALAGAASTAIAGVMPFLSAAFAAAPPTDAPSSAPNEHVTRRAGHLTSETRARRCPMAR